MANKLFLVSATLAFFFLLTNASVYRTVVEVDEDATNPAGPFRIPKCRKEFQQAQHLKACQQWLHKQAMQSGSGPSWTLDGEGQQMQQVVSRIYETATHLPRVCNIPQVSICPFQKTTPGPYY
uniref:Bifunctional inhibitor/plant lipid transfer protein/seed storage helical domain-containing protein n=1 Tax=Brassica campestris TaxID=3711 RepID=M4EC63_BRACM